jgi:hypothetical protein
MSEAKRKWMLETAKHTIGHGGGTAERWAKYLSALYDAIIAETPERVDVPDCETLEVTTLDRSE